MTGGKSQIAWFHNSQSSCYEYTLSNWMGSCKTWSQPHGIDCQIRLRRVYRIRQKDLFPRIFHIHSILLPRYSSETRSLLWQKCRLICLGSSVLFGSGFLHSIQNFKQKTTRSGHDWASKKFFDFLISGIWHYKEVRSFSSQNRVFASFISPEARSKIEFGIP